MPTFVSTEAKLSFFESMRLVLAAVALLPSILVNLFLDTQAGVGGSGAAVTAFYPAYTVINAAETEISFKPSLNYKPNTRK